jgi:hypothetical protein
MLSMAVARRAEVFHSELDFSSTYDGRLLDGSVKGMKTEACVAISERERDVLESLMKRFSCRMLVLLDI